MQVLNLDADLNISRLDADIRTLRLGEGGTTNYNDLTNKPSINSVILTGNKMTSDLNIKTSELVNDAGFITNANIPTKTSDLINDDGFQTAAQVSSAVAAAIPTDVSAFTNDAGYITAAQVGNIPTKTSDLTNDSGFITSAEAPVQSVNGYTGTVTLVASDIEVSAGVTVADDLSNLASRMPTKTSDLVNDSGFITSLNVPSKTSDLTNDSGFVTNQIDDSTTADTTTWSSDKIVSYIASIPQTATITDTPIASFTDGADNVPVSDLIVDIKAVQAGSGVPSPDNVREILGFDSGVITRCGVNLWDEEWELGIWNSNGTKGTANNAIRSKNYIAVAPNSSIYLVIPFQIIVRELDINKNVIRTVLPTKNQVFTSSPTTKYIVFCTYITDNITTYSDNISFNYPSSDTQYHAYNGNTYAVNFGQTVYGGTLNVSTGELTITHGYIASYNGEPINEPWISSIDEYAPNTSPSTGAEVVYPLSAPTSAQLTPTEVRTLLNNNNIFADTGDINELVYFKTGCEALARLIEAYT